MLTDGNRIVDLRGESTIRRQRVTDDGIVLALILANVVDVRGVEQNEIGALEVGLGINQSEENFRDERLLLHTEVEDLRTRRIRARRIGDDAGIGCVVEDRIRRLCADDVAQHHVDLWLIHRRFEIRDIARDHRLRALFGVGAKSPVRLEDVLIGCAIEIRTHHGAIKQTNHARAPVEQVNAIERDVEHAGGIDIHRLTQVDLTLAQFIREIVALGVQRWSGDLVRLVRSSDFTEEIAVVGVRVVERRRPEVRRRDVVARTVEQRHLATVVDEQFRSVELIEALGGLFAARC